jgi:hypothetical protein
VNLMALWCSCKGTDGFEVEARLNKGSLPAGNEGATVRGRTVILYSMNPYSESRRRYHQALRGIHVLFNMYCVYLG